jgi:hypothetical protein
MSAFNNFMELQLAAILGEDPEALVAIDKIAAELGPHATDAQREVVWKRTLKEKNTKPHLLFGGGASLLAKRPFLKQLELPLKQPASPVVADLAAIEENFKALALERERTLEDALADGEVRDVKKPDKKEAEDVVMEQSTPTHVQSLAASSSGLGSVSSVGFPPLGSVSSVGFPPLVATLMAEEPKEEPKKDAPRVLGDLSPAERAIADPDVAAILDDPEVLEIFTLMRQEVPESDIAEFTVLAPYLSKPREVLYTFGDIDTQNAITAEHPIYKEDAYPPANPLEDRNLFAAPIETLPKVLRRINMLKFTVEGSVSLPYVFAAFAKAVGLLQSDHINVYKRSETEFYILWFKSDQRTVKFPTDFKFTGRHTLCTSGGNTKNFHSKFVSVLKSLACMPRLVCLTVGELSKFSPTNVLAVCRDMSRTELLVTRLLAQMTSETERNSFQRALVVGWGTLQELISPKATRLSQILFYATDERVHKITEYPEWEVNGYDSFGLKGEYYDIRTEQMVECTLKQVMTDAAHPAHYGRRAVVIMGKTRDGKTELMKTLARRMAASHQRDLDISQRRFIVVRGTEQLRCEELRDHLVAHVPIIFDDLLPGKAMHSQAEPTSFLKNLMEPIVGEIYCRYSNVTLPTGPRIFTTNEADVKNWLRLRDNVPLEQAHLDAVLARSVFFRTTRRIYSDVMETSELKESLGVEQMLATTELAKLKEFGF